MATAGFPFSHDYDWRQQHLASAQPSVNSHHQQAAQAQHYSRLAALSNASATTTAAMAALSQQQQVQQAQQAAAVQDGQTGHPQNSLLASADPAVAEENRRTLQYISQLLDPTANSRETALLELSKKREQVPELALVLWHSFGLSHTHSFEQKLTIKGVMTALLQEIISVYPLLNPSQLTASASNRVCNALALLQCVASHNETRGLFLSGEPTVRVPRYSTNALAHIPLFLYPFLNTTSKSRPFEYLRLTSLGVIGALVKNDSSEVINFLLTTEIIPLCLRIMETGSELSKTVAIFIVQKILLDDTGLAYICQTYERFYAVGTVLSNMVNQLVEQQTVRLLKHVVRCFLR
jgi:CCR4-NOT transcription complex subunit 9